MCASQVALAVNNLPDNAGDTRNMGSVPGLGRSPGVRNGTPLQYSCQDNPMDRGAWWATDHGVTKSQTHLSTHTCTLYKRNPIDTATMENNVEII